VNSWNIPNWLETEVKGRDRECVYCRVQFAFATGPRRCIATWEHIVNDATIINRDNIVRCCVACNSSKGTKTLSDWLKSEYCRKRLRLA
jgi:5-methylcytosine-specific restriction endonuclease McrA